MNQEKEISFFKKLIISIIKIEKYPELASRKWGAVLSYMIKLLTIFVIVVSFASVYMMTKEFGQAIDYTKNNIPEFTFENNKLSLKDENPVIIENKDNNIFDYIILDTRSEISEEEINSYKNKIVSKTNGVIFLENKFLLKTEVTQNNVKEYEYSKITEKYQFEKFNKQDVLNYFSGNNLWKIYIGIFLLTFVYMQIIYFVSIWLDILLLGIFGHMTALIMRMRLRFSAMCKIAIHALTLPILLNACSVLLKTFVNFDIKYFEIMYIGIACIYIVATILMIKSDVIKNQEELAKIIEEQAKVKMELERQEEEKQKEKERENNKENDKEKQDEENKDTSVNNEPQGDNA